MAWVEGGFRLADAAATVYVIKARARRAGWTFERMALAYSALDARNPRAAFARTLPPHDVAEWGPHCTVARCNERWALLRAVARRALDGTEPNPTPGADHWGARRISNDVRRAKRAVDAGRWRTLKSETKNAFYATRARGAL